MSNENIKDIMKLWYHVLKSIVGAVLNISQNIAEIILGVPPILIQAKVNGIKHFLKLNINPVPNDRYIEFLATKYNDPDTSTSVIHSKFKDIFKFLQWKAREYNNHFTGEDNNIISNCLFGEFSNLSSKACSYSQPMINRYVECELWKSALKTQFQLEGYDDSPNPSCAKLPIPRNTTREIEVLLMSLLYKNNIMNSSLYKLGRVPSHLCSLCDREEETADHIIFRCTEVDEDLRRNAALNFRLANHLSDREDIATDFRGLLSASRHTGFITACTNILNSINLRTSVEL